MSFSGCDCPALPHRVCTPDPHPVLLCNLRKALCSVFRIGAQSVAEKRAKLIGQIGIEPLILTPLVQIEPVGKGQLLTSRADENLCFPETLLGPARPAPGVGGDSLPTGLFLLRLCQPLSWGMRWGLPGMLCGIGILCGDPPRSPTSSRPLWEWRSGLVFFVPWAKGPNHLLLLATPPQGQHLLLETQTWP